MMMEKLGNFLLNLQERIENASRTSEELGRNFACKSKAIRECYELREILKFPELHEFSTNLMNLHAPIVATALSTNDFASGKMKFFDCSTFDQLVILVEM